MSTTLIAIAVVTFGYILAYLLFDRLLHPVWIEPVVRLF